MPKLLHIDSSPLYGMSVSRELSATFVAQWKTAHPDGTIIDRDLNAIAIPPLTAAWVAAAFTPEASHTEEQKHLLSLSDTFLRELQEADEWVIGVPMHNFGISAVLKLWIDQVCRAGKTFAYVDGKPQGLLMGKKVTFIVATGGMYDAGTQMASFNHVEPYLKSVFGFLGVKDAKFLTAGGNHGAPPGQGPERVPGPSYSGSPDARQLGPLKLTESVRCILGLGELFSTAG